MTELDNPMIKDGVLCENHWQLVPKGHPELPGAANIIVPALLALEHQERIAQRNDIAVWLDSDEPPELIADQLPQYCFIAINFPVFSDGRGYSYARTLRQRFQYCGEVRAIGDVLLEQLFYLHRCGFSAFELREDQNIEEALLRFNDFSEAYQSGGDQLQSVLSKRLQQSN